MPSRYLEAVLRLLIVAGLAITAVVAPAPTQGTAPAAMAAPRHPAPAPAGPELAMDRHEHDVDIVE